MDVFIYNTNTYLEEALGWIKVTNHKTEITNQRGSCIKVSVHTEFITSTFRKQHAKTDTLLSNTQFVKKQPLIWRNPFCKSMDRFPPGKSQTPYLNVPPNSTLPQHPPHNTQKYNM